MAGLGYLDGASASPNMAAGTRLQLPLWLAEMLAVSQRLGTLANGLSLDLPAALAPGRVRNALRADARTVELRALATHFYGLGARVLALFDDPESAEADGGLAGLLVHVLLPPFPPSLDGSIGVGVGLGPGMGMGMDEQADEGVCRRTSCGRPRLLIWPTTRRAPLAVMPASSCAAWTRRSACV